MLAGWWSKARDLVRRNRRTSTPQRSLEPAKVVDEAPSAPPLHASGLAASNAATDIAQPDEAAIAAVNPDTSFAPPAFFSRLDDARFGVSVAYFVDGPIPGGFAALLPDAGDGDPRRASEINVQRYDAEGGAIGAEICVATVEAPEPHAPLIAALSDGGFAVAWSDPDDRTSALRVRLFSANAAPILGPIAAIANPTDAIEPRPQAKCLTRLPNGGAAISWAISDNEDPTAPTIYYVQCFGSDGAAAGPAMRTPAPACLSALPQKKHGAAQFAAAWCAPDTSAMEGALVHAAVFDTAETTVAFEIEVASAAQMSGAATIALSDGGFVVLWRGWRSSAIRGRRFDGHGAPIGAAFIAPRDAVEAIGWGQAAFLTLDPNGKLNAVWFADDEKQTRPVRILPSGVAAARRGEA